MDCSNHYFTAPLLRVQTPSQHRTSMLPIRRNNDGSAIEYRLFSEEQLASTDSLAFRELKESESIACGRDARQAFG